MDKVTETPMLGWQIEAAMDEQLASMQKQIDEQAELIAQLQLLVKHYENQLLMFKRRQFGRSSEKTDTDISQINLFPNPEPVDFPNTDETEEVSYTRKKRKGKREEDLSGISVERIEYELTDEARKCPECGEPMSDIGIGDSRRELKLIPAQVVVVEHAAHSYTCKNRSCVEIGGGTSIIEKAELPKALIPGSLASPSLVAHIISHTILRLKQLTQSSK